MSVWKVTIMKQARRSFIRNAAGVASLSMCGYAFPAITRTRSPNALLSHACIGTGNMARADLGGLMSHKRIHITALCDVDSTYLAAAKKMCPDARIYRDAFEMMASEGDRIDSVNVSTPDHTHAQYVLEALRRGLNVYGQKPLCHELADCRRIEQMAAKAGTVTQMGTQVAAFVCDRQTVNLLRSGVIGQVKKVWLFSTRRSDPPASAFEFPPKESSVPATLDWKLWLGPAKDRPYAAGCYHPHTWRRWRDFGSSWIGDLEIHLMSPIWLGLNLGTTGPKSVTAEVSDDGWTEAQKAAFWPRMCHITWTFPGIKATGGKPFEIEWCDGFGDRARYLEPKFLPPAFLQDIAARTPYGELPPQGRVVEGSDGWLLSTHYGVPPVVLMKNSAKSVPVSELSPGQSHYHEYVNCCLYGGKPTSSFAWAGRMTEMSLIGNAAQLKPGVTLNWDNEKGVLS